MMPARNGPRKRNEHGRGVLGFREHPCLAVRARAWPRHLARPAKHEGGVGRRRQGGDELRGLDRHGGHQPRVQQLAVFRLVPARFSRALHRSRPALPAGDEERRRHPPRARRDGGHPVFPAPVAHRRRRGRQRLHQPRAEGPEDGADDHRHRRARDDEPVLGALLQRVQVLRHARGRADRPRRRSRRGARPPPPGAALGAPGPRRRSRAQGDTEDRDAQARSLVRRDPLRVRLVQRFRRGVPR